MMLLELGLELRTIIDQDDGRLLFHVIGGVIWY